ncbi:MAG: hypothetical protein Q4F35_05085 [Akkermansia sp.]|nr:hypothetical protein [Akkermansia sp.]
MNIPSKFRPTGSGGLPPGYTRINYIDTDFLFGGVVVPIELNDDALEFRADVFFKQYGYGKSEAPVFSDVSQLGLLFLRLNSDGRTRAYWGGVDSGSYGNFRLAGTRRLITFRKGVFCIDGQAYEYSPVASLGDFVGKGGKPLFGLIKNGSPAKIYYYSYQVLKSGRLVFDGVPVLAPSGTIGAFDFVSRTFVPDMNQSHIAGLTLAHVRRLRLPKVSTNEGASPPTLTLALPWEAEFDEQAQAALQAAADKGWLLTIQYAPIDLPEFAGYVRADYLETTGYQWLQVTDLHLGSTSDVNMKFAPTDMTTWFNLFYCSTDLGYNRMGSLQQGRKIRYDSINQGYVYSSSELTGGSSYHVRQWGERNFLNGVEQASNEASNFTINAPTLIGKASHASTLSHMRIFWFKAAANINVYAIPAIDPNGTPCMFDIVSKTPYFDAGTSGVPFTVGLTKAQAETLVLGEKASGLTIAVPADTDLTLVEANNPGITIIIQTN